MTPAPVFWRQEFFVECDQQDVAVIDQHHERGQRQPNRERDLTNW
jgi:hypothetical protein